MKIKTIEVKNFKAIGSEIADFDGCSAIVTAGNNKGKSSLLRGLIDRFQGEKAGLILKQGKKNGFNTIEFTDGSKLEWSFTPKSERFTYITKEGVKQTTGVISTIGSKLFGRKFDIDKFLNSNPKTQIKELQALVGVDFSELDIKFKESYENRTYANKEVQRLRGFKLTKPIEVKDPNIDILKSDIKVFNEKIVAEHLAIDSENSELKKEWNTKNSAHLESIQTFNKKQQEIKDSNHRIIELSSSIQDDYEGTCLAEFIDFDAIHLFISDLPSFEDEELIESLPEPDYKEYTDYSEKRDSLQKELEEANQELRDYDKYVSDLEKYNNWIKEGKDAARKQTELDELVKSIEAEKRTLIRNANIPNEFEITDSEILYKGLPLTNTQQSSSSKYIAALKLGYLVLGELKTLHFDASFLDKKSLEEVQLWANDNDLQLLIERPDFDGGKIKYEII